MSERASLSCGCMYVTVGAEGSWYQVVACPEHVMDMGPHDQLPEPRDKK